MTLLTGGDFLNKGGGKHNSCFIVNSDRNLLGKAASLEESYIIVCLKTKEATHHLRVVSFIKI